jgi:Tfp pilus assembly protein FimT
MLRSGLTIMEVMIAVALASFVCAIGFTGINAFGKAITRSKQFTSETEMITAAMRMADDRADRGLNALPALDPVSTPKNWTRCKMNPDGLEFTLVVKNAQVGGKISGGLNMESGKNTLMIRALFIYDNIP